MTNDAPYPRLKWRGPVTHAEPYADYAISADLSNEYPILVHEDLVEVRVIRLGEYRKDLFGIFPIKQRDDLSTIIEIAKSHADQLDRNFWVMDQKSAEGRT